MSLASSDVTVRLNGGTFSAANGINIGAGSLSLLSGSLKNSTVSGVGGVLWARQGVLDSITLRRELTVQNNTTFNGGGTLSVVNGLTLDGGTFHVTWVDVNSLTIATRTHFTGTQTVSGTGTLHFDGFRQPQWIIQGSLTIGTGIVVRGAAETAYQFGEILNQGTIRADLPDRPFILNWSGTNSGMLTNHGLIEAAAGARAILWGALDNSAGVIRADGGEVSIGDGSIGRPAYTTAQLGTVQAINGGSINLGGTLNNSGATLIATTGMGTLYINATVNGGTLATQPGTELAAQLAALNDVTLTGQLSVRDAVPTADHALRLHNLNMAGGTISLFGFARGFGPTVHIHTSQDEIINGTGSIIFEGAGANNSIRPLAGVLTLGPGITVATGSGGGEIGVGGNPVVNQGRIRADAGQQIELANFSNLGLIEARNAGRILASSFSNSSNVTVEGGTFELNGNWSNSGGTISASTGGLVSLGGSWSNGGMILIADSTLNLGGTFTMQNYQIVHGNVNINGLWINTGNVVDLGAASTVWNLNSSGTIGGGTVITSGGTLSGKGGTLDSVVLQAPLNAQSSATRLSGSWSNGNTITLNGGTLNLAGTFASADLGTIIRNSGSVLLSGSFNNNASTLDLAARGWNLYAVGGTVHGGTIAGSASSLFQIGLGSSATVTLDGATLAVPTSIQSAGQIKLVNGLTLNSTLTTNSSATLDFQGTQVLGGVGTIVMNTVSSSMRTTIKGTGGTVTLGGGILIRTGTSGGTIGSAGNGVINQGTISSQTGSRGLAFLGNLTNQGLIETRNGGIVNLSSASLTNFSAGSLNGGRWAVYANSTMTMGSSTITINNADILLDGLGSTFVPINSIRTNLGSFSIDHGRNFTTVGSFTNSGYLGIGIGSTFHVVGDLDNSGSINLNGTLIVDGSEGESDMLEALRAQLLAGYNNGAWNGPGIHSSLAAAQVGSEHPTALGYADVPGAAQITYTWTGDTDLNGIVNAADLGNLALHWSSSGDWLDGDFNYDGIVNIRDLVLLAVNWQMTGTSLESALEAAGLPTVVVPEPVSLAFLALLIPWSLKRPCRRG